MIFLLLLITSILGFVYIPPIYNQNVNSVEKPIQEAINVNQYDLYSFVDLTSVDALNNYIAWVYLNDGVDMLNSTSSYTRGFSVSGNAYFVQSQNLTLSNIDTNTTRYFTVQNITLTSRGKVTNNNNWNNRFTMNFISTTDPDKMFSIVFFYIYNNSMNGTHQWFTEGIYLYDENSDLASYRSDLTLVVEYQESGMSYTRGFLPYNISSDSAYNTGYQIGLRSGYDNGYSVGYNQGFSDADGNFNMNSDMLTIFTGIIDVGLLPVNVFLTMFNFEVFGINIAGFISSLITISIVIIIIRFIFGGKKDD